MKKIFKIAAVAMAVLAAGCFMSCSEEDDEKSLAEILGVEIPEAPKVTLPEGSNLFVNELAGKTYENRDGTDADIWTFTDKEIRYVSIEDGVKCLDFTYTYVCDSVNKTVYAFLKSGTLYDDDGKALNFSSFESFIRINLSFLLMLESKDYITESLKDMKELFEMQTMTYTLDSDGNITDVDDGSVK